MNKIKTRRKRSRAEKELHLTRLRAQAAAANVPKLPWDIRGTASANDGDCS